MTGENLDKPGTNFMRDVVFGRNENLYNTTRATVGLGYLGLELIPSISRRVSSWWNTRQATSAAKAVVESIEATERAANEGIAGESIAAGSAGGDGFLPEKHYSCKYFCAPLDVINEFSSTIKLVKG